MSRPFVHPVTFTIALLTTALISMVAASAAGVDPPLIPVGLDAYRMWDRWPYQQIGVRAYMRSTYDRSGRNESADASHFLYQLADDFNVTLDVEGKGVLCFARYNHWHGSPWHYVVDGNDHIVRESSTANPLKPVPNSVFIPENLFPSPLAFTWSRTKGADLMWVPIPFERSFQMAYSRTRYGTGYYIYRLYADDANLSQPIKAWDAQTPPDPAVLELIGRAGVDIAPKPAKPTDNGAGSVNHSGQAPLYPGETVVLASMAIHEAPSTIRALQLSVPRDAAIDFSRSRLRLTWDGRVEPSVDAPVALFFGAGSLYNRDNREWLVRGFPMNIRYDEDRVILSCYYPMPLFRSAEITLTGDPVTTRTIESVQWSVRAVPYTDPPEHVGYFHATYKDISHPELGQDITFLDTRETEGGGDWSGAFVGMSWIFSHRAVLGTLEGDPRFFFDDSNTPQAYGTGTEEWGGGGDYWGGQNMTLPFAGHPVGARDAASAHNEEDKIESAYRFLLADSMPFGRNARINLEHGGLNQSTEHYEGVVYWYGAPGATLVKTDSLQIGDPASEAAHRYESPDASAPITITSRYELGVDTLPSTGNFPLPDPVDYAEFEFEADAGRRYFIWAHGKNTIGSNTTDATWFQFDDTIGTTRLGDSYGSAFGFGNWLDGYPKDVYAWASAMPHETPQWIEFKTSGTHRLRIQSRHSPHHIDQIWLSTSQAEEPDFKTTVAKPPSRREGAPIRDIVLIMTDASATAGKFKIVDDPGGLGGKALRVDSKGGSIEAYPFHTDTGRVTSGTTEFTLALRPDNLGVLLRRKLDYAHPNQRAEVYVADAATEATDWKLAGIWYLAGANTCVYSDASGELGETKHIVQTSNRRFRDDEFLIPRRLTEGRKAIRVRVAFTPVERPLFPGDPIPRLGWSEIRYDAYCYVLPPVQ